MRFSPMISHRVKRQDYFWAAISGALLTLSFPTFDLWPLAWIFLLPLLLCTRGKDGKSAFFLGGFAGIVAYSGILYWIVVAVYKYGGIPLPIAVPILLLLVLYLSLYWGAFTYFASYFQGKMRWTSIVVFPALWVGLEYLRSFLLSGFPWALVGYSQYRNTPCIQIADVTGVYGISFLIVLVNVLLFLWYIGWREKRNMPFKSTIFVMALVALTIAYGLWKIHSPIATRGLLRVGVVQGNIAQDMKWDKGFQKETLKTYRGLTISLRENSPRLIIWPETAFPSYFPSGTKLDGEILAIPPLVNSYLLFGSLFYTKSEKRDEVYNSVYLLSPTSQILGRYDKIHLVPFGEYIPLPRLLSLINSLGGIHDISAGKEAVIFQLPEGRFGTLICFEVIFPELCREFVRKGADFMVTITNDAWFERTSAPYQHLALATFRSIENRLWLVRAANTGVSAFIDPWGRIRKATGIFTREVLSEEISLAGGELTFYARYGDLFAIICSIVGMGLLGYASLKKQVIWT